MSCINLAFGEVHFPTPLVICEAMAKSVMRGDLCYAAPQGEENLLDMISSSIISEEKAICLSENIIIVPGAKQGIMYIFNLLRFQGKKVAIIEPTWRYYIEMLEYAGAEIFGVKYDEKFLQRLKLIENLHTVIIINPNNPDGRIWGKLELNELKGYCEQENIYIICDEVYKDFVYTDGYCTFLEQNKVICQNVIIIRSFSKSFAMSGARIGYIIADKRMIKRICRLQNMYINNVPVFIQQGCIAGLLNKPKFQTQMKDYYYKNMMYMYNILINTKHFMPIQPNGGLCMLVDVSTWADSVEKAYRFLYTKGILCSGVLNYTDEISKKYIRLSFCHERSVIKEAMRIIVNIDKLLMESNSGNDL